SILSAVEVNGMEDEMGLLPVENDGTLRLTLKPFGICTIRVRLRAAESKVPSVISEPVSIPYNVRGISTNANRQDGNIDGQGNSLPSEQLPAELHYGGVRFITGPRG